MGTTQTAAAPIFVVGSPRSGTSILTWCLGQHPNILPSEESDWLGAFAAQAAALHARGSARGERSQLSALGVERAEFLRDLGNAVDAMILGHRRRLEQLNRVAAQRDPRQVRPGFAASRSDAEPKARWVDGTPEYSLYICGLHKLFPGAKFIHILRDVDDVVASMVPFRHVDGRPLVHSPEEAYAYWERTTRACVLAEQALGERTVLRLPYADLVERPEAALRKVLEFLGEPFREVCLEPLRQRINSSRTDAVPAPAASAAVARARNLSAQLREVPTATVSPASAREQFETTFEDRVRHFAHLDADYASAQAQLQQRGDQLACEIAKVARLHKVLDWCGVLLAVQAAVALALVVYGGDFSPWPPARNFGYAAIALSSTLVYVWLRRRGARRLWRRIWRARRAVAEKFD